MSTDCRNCLGTARTFERGGQIWLTLPRRVMRLYRLRAGDTVRWRKLPRQNAWRLTFFRRGRPLRPIGTFPAHPPSTR